MPKMSVSYVEDYGVKNGTWPTNLGLVKNKEQDALVSLDMSSSLGDEISLVLVAAGVLWA